MAWLRRAGGPEDRRYVYTLPDQTENVAILLRAREPLLTDACSSRATRSIALDAEHAERRCRGLCVDDDIGEAASARMPRCCPGPVPGLGGRTRRRGRNPLTGELEREAEAEEPRREPSPRTGSDRAARQGKRSSTGATKYTAGVAYDGLLALYEREADAASFPMASARASGAPGPWRRRSTSGPSRRTFASIHDMFLCPWRSLPYPGRRCQFGAS